MTRVFITGLSGVGKTATLEYLAQKGYSTLDTDYGYTKEINGSEGVEIILNEEKIHEFLAASTDKDLFLSGCYANQGALYPHFDEIVLLTAELPVMLDRIERRSTSNYGKVARERQEVLDSYEEILPLLKPRANLIIDTTNQDIATVGNELLSLIKKPHSL